MYSTNSACYNRNVCLHVAKCIDHYTLLRVKRFEETTTDTSQEIDPRLENVVNRMFDRCFTEHKFQQAAGIALETRRIDLLERAIQESVSFIAGNGWELSAGRIQ